jgi:hypothetical protein
VTGPGVGSGALFGVFFGSKRAGENARENRPKPSDFLSRQAAAIIRTRPSDTERSTFFTVNCRSHSDSMPSRSKPLTTENPVNSRLAPHPFAIMATTSFFCRTSKMSHDGSWRAACLTRKWIPTFHFDSASVARGMPAPGVGSGALLAERTRGPRHENEIAASCEKISDLRTWTAL